MLYRVTLKILVLAAFMVALVGSATAAKNWKETGNSKAATEAKSCVRETTWMRSHHFTLIEHDRDITVHQGVRTVDGSMAECVACHANKDEAGNYIAVDDPGQFCAACHQYTGVTFDCFSCHATKPGKSGY